MTLYLKGCGLGIGMLLAFAGNAAATVISPTVSTDDITPNGNCTLREAIQAANTDAAVDQCPAGSGADVIKLGAATYDLSIIGSLEDANATGDLDVSRPLTIQGAGTGATTIDAQGVDRAIDILTNAPTTIQDLTVTNGRLFTPLNHAGPDGGGIRAQSALTLTNVSVTNSRAGDGIAVAFISGNAPGPPGNPGGDGGGVWTSAPLTVTGGSFTGDHAGAGSGGIHGGDGASSSGQTGGAGGAGGAGGSGGAIAVIGGPPLTISGASFSNDTTGVGGTGGDGGNGGTGSGGPGGAGGDGGAGGRGGDGGAIFATGNASITAISTSTTSTGDGGVAGRGGRGAGGTSQGFDGANGTSGQGGNGGAIAAGSGTLTVSGATLTAGTAGTGAAERSVDVAGIRVQGGGAGPGGNGGAIFSGGTVAVDHTTVSFSHAGAGGAGATNSVDDANPGGAGGSGGGIDGNAVTVTATTISDSGAGAGGAGGTGFTDAPGGPGGGGGAVHARGTVSLTGVTLDHDTAGTGGPGVAPPSGAQSATAGGAGGAGGAVLADAAGTITNSTLVSDRAGDGGAGGDSAHSRPAAAGGPGGSGGAIRAPSAALALLHVSAVDNAAGAGGAGGAPGGATGSAGTVGGVLSPGSVAASVIADNAAPQCSGTLNGSGNVSFPDASCGGINADPKLGPLDNNGGPTQTLLPAVGSPPLDTIATGGVGCAAGDTDQRGTPRPQGAKCDSGSVEAANPAIATDIAAADFGSIPAGRRATRTITIRSTFDPVHPTLALAGPGATAFAVTTNPCAGVLLAPAATCAVQVTFTSSGTPGARTATLHLAHDRLGAAIDVALTAAVAPAPAVSALSLSHTRFAVAGAVTARAKARRQRPPQGTTIRFRLSSPGSVAFAVTQSAPGRKRGKRCVAPTRILAHAKHCTRILVKGTFVRAEPAGSIRVPFSGRLRGGALQPGRYTLVLTPSDAAHNRGRGDSIGFTIVRRR